ncbi:hypothetical protein BGZ60DRAFT_413295 [Tricladium varicosporioides]|nr:hypothetical protein BGZ60DRAFT_413295 [Hymenoscyphus varicosporioides]
MIETYSFTHLTAMSHQNKLMRPGALLPQTVAMSNTLDNNQQHRIPTQYMQSSLDSLSRLGQLRPKTQVIPNSLDRPLPSIRPQISKPETQETPNNLLPSIRPQTQGIPNSSDRLSTSPTSGLYHQPSQPSAGPSCLPNTDLNENYQPPKKPSGPPKSSNPFYESVQTFSGDSSNPHKDFRPRGYEEALTCPPSLEGPQMISVHRKSYDRHMASQQRNFQNMHPYARAHQDRWVLGYILRSNSGCVNTWPWYRYRNPNDLSGGYRCKGGHHLITDGLIAEGKGGYWAQSRTSGRDDPVWVGPFYTEDEEMRYYDWEYDNLSDYRVPAYEFWVVGCEGPALGV